MKCFQQRVLEVEAAYDLSLRNKRNRKHRIVQVTEELNLFSTITVLRFM